MTGFDFTDHRAASARRNADVGGAKAESWAHLEIILGALEAQPGKAFALTEGAEPAAHELMLDTPTVLSYSRSVLPGHVLSHDPFAWGTEAFAEAVANTAAAFEAEGLPAPSVHREGEYRAAMCFLSFAPV